MMRPSFIARMAIFVSLCSALLFLSGCATTARTDKSIESRATARWHAILKGDLVDAYDYLSPGYRSSVSLNQYQRQILLMRVKWKDARYLESDCTETTCKVKISLDYVLYGALPGVKSFEGTQTIEESWVRIDDIWYFVPDN